MNQVEVGKFIAACRKEKQLTQAQLAELLNITDRAVSKWETGKSMPDSSIMLELCQILGITVNELLSGERITEENFDTKADKNLLELKRKTENNFKINLALSAIFTALFLIGIAVCVICDLAVNKKLTWSRICISSIFFAWAVVFPILLAGRRGILKGAGTFSICLIPYLYSLSRIIGVGEIFSVGVVLAVISILYLWLMLGICHGFRGRKSKAAGLCLLMLIPFCLIINYALAGLLPDAGPVIDVWDIYSLAVIFIMAIIFFLSDRMVKKEPKQIWK